MEQAAGRQELLEQFRQKMMPAGVADRKWWMDLRYAWKQPRSRMGWGPILLAWHSPQDFRRWDCGGNQRSPEGPSLLWLYDPEKYWNFICYGDHSLSLAWEIWVYTTCPCLLPERGLGKVKDDQKAVWVDSYGKQGENKCSSPRFALKDRGKIKK